MLGVVNCYFNFCNYRSKLDAFETHRAKLGAIGQVTVECVTEGQQTGLAGFPGVHTVAGDILFQKERLWSIGAQLLLDRGCTKLCFLDADTLYSVPDWQGVVDTALDKSDLIQPYSLALKQWSDRRVSKPACFKTKNIKDSRGLGFACTKEFFEKVGLYEHCITGSGDSAMCYGAITNYHHSLVCRNKYSLDHFYKWRAKMIEVKIGYADLTLACLPHGRIANRAYQARHTLLETYNPYEDVTHNGGAFLFTDKAQPKMIEGIARYFKDRREDD